MSRAAAPLAISDGQREVLEARAQRITAIKKTIADNNTRCKRLIQALEITDELDQDFIQDIKTAGHT